MRTILPTWLLQVGARVSQRTASILTTVDQADTVVLTYPQPILSSTPDSELLGFRPEVIEKPISRDDNLRMLLDLNGNRCEVVTGVSIGE